MPKQILVVFLLAVGLLSHGCASGPPPTAVELGEAALGSGDWRLAKTHFAEALKLDSRSGRAWFGQSRAQLAGRDPEAALRSLASLAKIDRGLFLGQARATYTDALESATLGRLARDQTEAALVSVRALVKLEPRRPGLDRLLGRVLVGEADRLRWAGDRTSALLLYREAVRVVPQTLEAWVGAAELLLEARKGKEAVALLETARKYHPTAGMIRALSLQAMAIR